MDFSSIMDIIGNSGAGDAASSGAGNGWAYWAKAIQDAVIGQSAGFDAAKQNQESEPLALQATGSKPVEGATRGTYKYNYEGQVPFLQGFSGLASGGRSNDPLYKQDVDKITKNAQNNASGSNGALDTSLNEDARKVAGVSEGGAKPQLFATSIPKNQSFNSMMDSYENLGLPLDNPKNRQGSMFGNNAGGGNWGGVVNWISNLFGGGK